MSCVKKPYTEFSAHREIERLRVGWGKNGRRGKMVERTAQPCKNGCGRDIWHISYPEQAGHASRRAAAVSR